MVLRRDAVVDPSLPTAQEEGGPTPAPVRRGRGWEATLPACSAGELPSFARPAIGLPPLCEGDVAFFSSSDDNDVVVIVISFS
jgi:hypothetical protein